MKQPKISKVKLDKRGTKLIRETMAKSKKVKITINFDADILNEVKKLAYDLGSPYQTLLNKLLKESLVRNKSKENRLDRIEKELKALKRKIA